MSDIMWYTSGEVIMKGANYYSVLISSGHRSGNGTRMNYHRSSMMISTFYTLNDWEWNQGYTLGRIMTAPDSFYIQVF
jgi:hypothetical protein